MSEQNQPERQTRLKRSTPDRRDCVIKWIADFPTKEMTLHADFIAADMVLYFLNDLLRSDARFHDAGIENVVDLCKRFTVMIWVRHEDSKTRYYIMEAGYQIKAWPTEMSDDASARELELTPLGVKERRNPDPIGPMGRAARMLFESIAWNAARQQEPNKQPASDAPSADALPYGQSRTAAGQIMPQEGGSCEHDWQPDGQTMTSVRWTCAKCGKTKHDGIDI